MPTVGTPALSETAASALGAFAEDAVDRREPLTVAAAYAQCRDAALAESVIGAIGLEIESHLVDLDHVADHVPWRRVEAIAAVVRKVAPGTAVGARVNSPPRRFDALIVPLAVVPQRNGPWLKSACLAKPSTSV